MFVIVTKQAPHKDQVRSDYKERTLQVEVNFSIIMWTKKKKKNNMPPHCRSNEKTFVLYFQRKKINNKSKI